MDSEIIAALIVAAGTIVGGLVGGWASYKYQASKAAAPSTPPRISVVLWLWGAAGAVLGALLVLAVFALAGILPSWSAIVCPPSVFLEQNGEVVMEAEHFTYMLPGTGKAIGSSWKPAKQLSGYTGDSAMETVPNEDVNTKSETTGPALLYVIKFQTVGDYYVYVRGYARSLSDDSIHVGLAGNAVTTSGYSGFTEFRLERFSWQNHHHGADETYVDTVVNVPTPGIYTFYVWMREDGMVVDRIWLSIRKDVINNDNTDPGPAESPRTQLW